MSAAAAQLPSHLTFADIYGTHGSTLQAGVFISSSGQTEHERLLNRLPVALQAPFDASSQQDNSFCLPETRTAVLEEMRDFFYSSIEQKHHIFWLEGMAGTGKSTIARTMAKELHKEGVLGASFFFTRGGGDVAHAGLLFTSIARQLARTSPELEKMICESIKNNPDVATKARGEQWATLIQQPLSKVQRADPLKTLVIVLDALDECGSDNDMKGVIALLAEAKSISNVSCRPCQSYVVQRCRGSTSASRSPSFHSSHLQGARLAYPTAARLLSRISGGQQKMCNNRTGGERESESPSHVSTVSPDNEENFTT